MHGQRLESDARIPTVKRVEAAQQCQRAAVSWYLSTHEIQVRSRIPATFRKECWITTPKPALPHLKRNLSTPYFKEDPIPIIQKVSTIYLYIS